MEGCLPSKVVFLWRLSSSKVVFHRRSSSIEGRFPSKVVLHGRCLPSKVVFEIRAAPELPPKWIKQNELGRLDNMTYVFMTYDIMTYDVMTYFYFNSVIYGLRAPCIPKFSFLPVLEPTEKISNGHTHARTHAHTHTRTHAHALHYYIDTGPRYQDLQTKCLTCLKSD